MQQGRKQRMAARMKPEESERQANTLKPRMHEAHAPSMFCSKQPRHHSAAATTPRIARWHKSDACVLCEGNIQKTTSVCVRVG